MTRTVTALVTILLLAVTVALTACGSDEPATAPTLTEIEDRYWTAYEQRLGLVGTDYADPARARQGSIDYGYFLCTELAKGIDRGVLLSRGSNGPYTREEFEVQIDTAVEFLCPNLG